MRMYIYISTLRGTAMLNGLWAQHTIEKSWLQNLSDEWDSIGDPLKMICGCAGGLALDSVIRLSTTE